MDWKTLITDITAAGFTQEQIAKKVGTCQAAISDLSRGRTSNPRWKIGNDLIALHKRVMARPSRKANHQNPAE